MSPEGKRSFFFYHFFTPPTLRLPHPMSQGCQAQFRHFFSNFEALMHFLSYFPVIPNRKAKRRVTLGTHMAFLTIAFLPIIFFLLTNSSGAYVSIFAHSHGCKAADRIFYRRRQRCSRSLTLLALFFCRRPGTVA